MLAVEISLQVPSPPTSPCSTCSYCYILKPITISLLQEFKSTGNLSFLIIPLSQCLLQFQSLGGITVLKKIPHLRCGSTIGFISHSRFLIPSCSQSLHQALLKVQKSAVKSPPPQQISWAPEFKPYKFQKEINQVCVTGSSNVYRLVGS